MSKKDKQQALAGLIAALMSGGSAQVIRIEPKDGESMEDAIARYEAEHREQCPGCAAEYAEEQANARKGADDMVARAKAAAATEKAEKAAAGAQTEGVGADPLKADKRTPIGYLVRTNISGETKYIKGSFTADRAEAEGKLEIFRQFMPIDDLNAVAKKIGAPQVQIDVVPVFV